MVGVRKKRPKRTLCMKKSICESSLNGHRPEACFSRKFCFCPEFRKAIHTQHFKLRIKLLLGRRVIDAEENLLSNYRLFENVGLQKRVRHLPINVQLQVNMYKKMKTDGTSQQCMLNIGLLEACCQVSALARSKLHAKG